MSKFIEEARTHAPTLLNMMETLTKSRYYQPIRNDACRVLQVQASTDEFAPKDFVSFMYFGHCTKKVCHIIIDYINIIIIALCLKGIYAASKCWSDDI